MHERYLAIEIHDQCWLGDFFRTAVLQKKPLHESESHESITDHYILMTMHSAGSIRLLVFSPTVIDCHCQRSIREIPRCGVL